MQQMARSKVLEQQAKHPHLEQDGGESLSCFPGKDPPVGRYEAGRRIHKDILVPNPIEASPSNRAVHGNML